jgi:haloalkane dehalogenase
MLSTGPLKKQTIKVHGRKMAFHDAGSGPAIVFLHGNPTSSYLWRNVLPPLRGHGRFIVPDLIGMGDSEKLPNPGPETYNYSIHRKFLWTFLEDVIPSHGPIVFVAHDWGSALAFDWALHHQDRIRGIAYMEALVRPFLAWDEWTAVQELFHGFRSPRGEEMILDKNIFVEQLLFASNIRKLTDVEMAEYRRPFEQPAHRWPTLTWPRQIPIGGEPAEVAHIVRAYASWLPGTGFPKLFINAEPGAILVGVVREFCRTWNNQTEVTVPGVHFVQEDSGPEIGQAIARWMSDCKL